MSVKDDGGAAFPTQSDQDVRGDFVQGQQGMSLRDYFAAKAMQGLCANQDWMMLAKTNSENHIEVSLSQAAYSLADAMLEARKE